MTREEAINRYIMPALKRTWNDNLCVEIKQVLEREPCEDAISRQVVLDIVNNPLNIRLDEIIKKIPPVNPQPKTGQFAKWVAKEIFDEMWEYNKDSFAELACRKLSKLGIVIRMGDEWVLVEQKESEE